MLRVNLALAVAMVLTLVLAASIIVYVAYPYRGHESRWLGRWVAPLDRAARRARRRVIQPPVLQRRR